MKAELTEKEDAFWREGETIQDGHKKLLKKQKKYKVEFSKKFEEKMATLSDKDAKKLTKAIEKIRKDPLSVGTPMIPVKIKLDMDLMIYCTKEGKKYVAETMGLNVGAYGKTEAEAIKELKERIIYLVSNIDFKISKYSDKK